MATPTESAALRALQAHTLLLGDSESLDWGVAYVCPRFPNINTANQLREVAIERADDIARAFDEVTDRYTAAGLKCHRWALAADQPPDAIGRFLSARGFRREDHTVMTVDAWVDVPAADGVRVLPARAMRKALDAILIDAHPGPLTPQRDAAVERLNDPRMEGCVAIVGGAPAGYCTFFEVGDIGYISDLFVSDPHRRRGVGTALMGHVLRLARRLMMRVTCLRVPVDAKNAESLFTRCGLRPDGVVTEFVDRQAGD